MLVNSERAPASETTMLSSKLLKASDAVDDDVESGVSPSPSTPQTAELSTIYRYYVIYECILINLVGFVSGLVFPHAPGTDRALCRR